MTEPSAQPWPAPHAVGPVVADVHVPASKSMTNRALVLGSLASGTSVLHHPLRSRDSSLMVGALRALGSGIDDSDAQRWTIVPGRATSKTAIDVGNAGTVLRFVPPLASLAGVDVAFDGDDAARRRPVGQLLSTLRSLGVDVDDAGGGALPFTIRGMTQPPGGNAEIDASSSSQLVSALLLAAPAMRNGIDLRHVGDRPVPNAPHVAMTVAMLQSRRVDVMAEDRRWRVSPGAVAAVDEAIEPDLSSAAPFLAAAVVTGGRVRIADWPAPSTQPGGLLPSLLEAFDATSSLDDDGLTITGADRVTGADLDLRNAGELTPVIAAIAALADTPSRLSGIDYLRGHETDRLAALAREITALGGDVRELDDGLEIRPARLHGGVFSTYDDHRLAMAAAVLGLVVAGIEIENVATTGKTFPGFADIWAQTVSADPTPMKLVH